MSTQTGLATGGNVIGQGIALHPTANKSQQAPPVPRIVWVLLGIFILAGIVSAIMCTYTVLHAYTGSVTQNSSAGYTYTATYNPAVIWWLVITALCCVIIPVGVYNLSNWTDYFVSLQTTIMIVLTGLVLLGVTILVMNTSMLKADLASHANGWLQQHLNTTYDVTNEIGAQDRFTQKLDALTIDGQTVNFYLSRANNTVIIRPTSN